MYNRLSSYFSFMVTLVSSMLSVVYAQHATNNISSPDGNLVVSFKVEKGRAFYKVRNKSIVVLESSKLGIAREDGDFLSTLNLITASGITSVVDNYTMNNAKKSSIIYKANRRIFSLQNSNGKKMDIIFQVSNDGVAFRYYFPGIQEGIKRVTEEITSYNFRDSAKAFLQPMQVAKTGWEQTNPAYEEHYKQNMSVGTPAPENAGWVYPALFQSGNNWVLITEASLDSNYCATRLKSASPSEYSIGFPDPREVFTGGGLLPQFELPYYSPWRIITIGSLKTIAESTLGTDLAQPAVKMNTSFIKPGKSSWSWIMSKDNFIIFEEQKKYIDYAADMKWQYCLIDADWDRKIGYDSIKILAEYAKTKNVGLLLWYNSSGEWNTVKYTPKSKLLTHEDRVKEFSYLKEIGIKGVKIDFFGGDGQSMIKYYIDILNDAAQYQLMVNFHGATLPRGWHRTYPHLLTTEAVRGFEMITFNQADADVEANHCAMLPFTRNAFDPMDFTPMNLYRIQSNVKRKTTSSFELALSVLFLSGIQHFAESPEGMSHVPEYVKQYLRDLPTHWDDVNFLDGYPGKHIVIARKSGSKWYIGAINGGDTEKHLTLDLTLFNSNKGTLITAGKDDLFNQQILNVAALKRKEITLKPNDGFVMVLE